MRILTRLNEGVASPNEMAKEFEESLPLVSYHVRILRELDCIELVRTTPRRGAIEHHYRALTRPFLDDADWRAAAAECAQGRVQHGPEQGDGRRARRGREPGRSTTAPTATCPTRR